MKKITALLVLAILLSVPAFAIAENPQVIQRTVSTFNSYNSEAAGYIGSDDRDSFKESVKKVFNFHDLAPQRYKDIIVDYSKQGDLLNAEKSLKQTLKQGLDKFGIPGDGDDDISSSMIKLIRDDSVHIVPENKPSGGGFPSIGGPTLGWGVFAVFIIIIIYYLVKRKTIGNLLTWLHIRKGPVIGPGGVPPGRSQKIVEEEAVKPLQESVEELKDIIRRAKGG